MQTSNLNIVMLMFQPSVVARGLEKKLTELNNKVSSIIGDFSEIDSFIGVADLFILNLPTKIADDTKELKTLVQISEKVTLGKKALIVVGERELWEEFSKIFPGITKFIWVYRPVEIRQLEAAIESVDTVNEEKARKHRVLIVDDDPAYAKMVREWIKEYVRVDIVTAGMQAITFLVKVPEDDPVDLILLDYEMPVVDGAQVLQMLKQDEDTARIPVIFLTGVGTRESVKKVMELKPDGYILKTTTRENLLEILNDKIRIY